MSAFRYLARVSIGIGTVGGLCAYVGWDRKNILEALSISENNNNNINGNSNGFAPAKWDFNWDKRETKRLAKSASGGGDNEEVCVKPKAVRHLILIRHGQYNLEGIGDKQRTLTTLGREQAAMTGKRLKELDLPYTELVHSTMTRAMETADIIRESIPNIPTKECSLLEEGAPIPPEPPVGHWKPPHYQFHQDGARIEAAFRKYFHRADPKQEVDSYSIVVCHANVIRYFVCRSLQYPPEGWLRLSLKHASITWLSILPSGRVLLRCYGDAGYMPPYALTTS